MWNSDAKRLNVKSAGKYSNNCVTSGFRRQVDENCALLGYYLASSGNFLPMFRDNQSAPSVCVKTLNLKMGPISYSEMSVRKYHYSLRNNPEDLGP